MTTGLPDKKTYEYDEGYIVPDVGCEWSSTCKKCPMPKCKYDVPTEIMRLIHEYIKTTEMVLLYNEGTSTVKEIAKRLGISEVTIARSVRKHKRPLHPFVKRWLIAAKRPIITPIERAPK